LLAAAPAAAQPVPQREPGTVFHICSAAHDIPILRFLGAEPRLAVRRGGQVETMPMPASERDRFSARAEVDPDGSLRDLDMSWYPPGMLGWPQTWRPDLHPVYVNAKLDRPWVPSGAPNLFEPGMLNLELEFRSERRLNGVWAFQFTSTEYGRGRAELLALAQVPYWRRSARLALRWTIVEQLAEGRPRIAWQFAPATFWDQRHPHGLPTSGQLDLSFMPAVIEGFRTLEARLRERIARAPELCERQVEPEPPDEATITTTATRTN
jgi:hypothetical protein